MDKKLDKKTIIWIIMIEMMTRRQFILKIVRFTSAAGLISGGSFVLNRNSKETSDCTGLKCPNCSRSDKCKLPTAMSWRKQSIKNK